MSHLFSPGAIGTMKLRNRIVRSATEELRASGEGRGTDYAGFGAQIGGAVRGFRSLCGSV